MLNRYLLIVIALISWTLFGILIVTAGAYFILHYGQIQNAIAVGACLGALIGLIVGVVGSSPVVSANRVGGFRWALLGSMSGAVIGAGFLLWLGGFPRRTQADLSLVFLGPASFVIGSITGLFSAAALWHLWRSR